MGIFIVWEKAGTAKATVKRNENNNFFIIFCSLSGFILIINLCFFFHIDEWKG